MTDRLSHLAHIGEISNGHISARGRPIHFMFGSTVGFSGSADRMALFPVWPNPRWRLGHHQPPSEKNIAATTSSCNQTQEVFLSPGRPFWFSRSAYRMALFPVSQNPRWRPNMAARPPSRKIQMAISPRRIIRFTPCLVLWWGFRGMRIEWR